MIWRLVQDWLGLFEGSCISEEKYKRVYYLDKCLFEPITDEEIPFMIEYKNPDYCMYYGIDKILFHTQEEMNKFEQKFR